MNARRAPLGRDAAATVALCLYTIVVAAGFSRVFSGWEFLDDLGAVVVVGHTASFVMRRAGVTGWIAVPALTVVMFWLITVVHYRDTVSWWLPTRETWDVAWTELTLVRDQFPTAVAPVLYGAGWAPLAGFALVLVVVLSDTFAFRAGARGEALVPGGALFVFVGALGSERLRVASAVALVAAGVLATIALRRLHDRRSATLSARPRRLPWALPAAALSAALIAVLAGVVGPRIPGAHAEALYDTTGGSGTNFVNSPFVDIRSRLTNRGNVDLFRVNADSPEYWRLITLAAFDGDQFTLPARPLDDVDAADMAAAPEPRRIRQQIQILALEGELVPAAADPVQASLTRADGEELGLRRQLDSSTLISTVELAPGDVFDVVSFAPSPTVDQLRTAGVSDGPDPIYLELPDDLPDFLYEQTTALTAAATTPYDAAIAIQTWFRDPTEFTYSLEVQAGHGSNAIDSFFRNRAGYCEQFAATFAAMARAAGIPSRVAVGYTPGLVNEPGWYTVIGKNAHAWPELWFDGIGWVMFEPTPGRGSASAEGYTGVAAQQDESGPDTGGGATVDGGGEVTQPTTPPTIEAAVPDADTTTTTLAPLSDGSAFDPGSGLVPDAFTDELGGDPSQGRTDSSSFPWLPLLVVCVAVAGLTGPPATRRLMRARQRAGLGVGLVRASWSRAIAVATDAGVSGSASMTPSEWTAATAKVLPVAARPMANLAEIVDRVMFAPPGAVDLDRRGSIGTRVGDDCELWANQVCMIATDVLPTTTRLKRYFLSYR